MIPLFYKIYILHCCTITTTTSTYVVCSSSASGNSTVVCILWSHWKKDWMCTREGQRERKEEKMKSWEHDSSGFWPCFLFPHFIISLELFFFLELYGSREKGKGETCVITYIFPPKLSGQASFFYNMNVRVLRTKRSGSFLWPQCLRFFGAALSLGSFSLLGLVLLVLLEALPSSSNAIIIIWGIKEHTFIYM